MRFNFLLVVLLAAAFSFSAVPGDPEVIYPVTTSVQPSGSDSLHWSFAKYVTHARNGRVQRARGIEVKSTSTGGNIKLHLTNDYDAAGRKVWLIYTIPASAGSTQRIGFIFDEVDSAATTILNTDVIIWY